MAGHRRLVHELGETGDLEGREAELGAREAELSRRERDLAHSRPADRGMLPCPECGSWMETADNLRRHCRSIHPIENTVAAEVRVSPERVSSVWTEACRKQERHPSERRDQIVRRFWDGTDRRILNRLLARNAVFQFAKEGE